MAVNPVAKVELSLEAPGATPVWVDISTYVLADGIQTNRGRPNELSRTQPGTASVQLNNHGATFDPTNASELVNLILNPSVEVGTTGYAALLSTISRTAPSAQSGGFGLLVITTAVSESGFGYNGGVGNVLVTPGLTYTVSVALRLALAGSKGMRIRLRWLNAASGLISDDNTTFTLSSTTSARYSHTSTAPALAVRAEIYVVTQSGGGVFDFHADALQFEQAAAATAYADGSLAGHSWSGTAHASTSRRGGSPFYPNLRPRNRMRIFQTWDAIEYPAFDGFVEGWTPEYPGGNASVLTVPLVDAFGLFAARSLSQVRPYAADRTNLLRNPGVEFDLNDYLSDAATIALREPSRQSAETNAILVTTTNVDSSGVRYDQDANLVVAPGLTYTASLYAVLAVAGSKNFELKLQFRNAAGLVNEVTKDITVDEIAQDDEPWPRFYVSGTAGALADRARIHIVTQGAQGVFNFLTDNWSLEQAATNFDDCPAERSDIRVGRVLDTAGHLAADRDLGVGASTLLPQTGLVGTGLLAYLQLIETSEQGRIWIGPDGKVVFRSRWALGQVPYISPQAIFGPDDLPYKDLTPSFDLTYVRNLVSLTGIQEDAVEQVVRDPVSIAAYGEIELRESGLLVGDNELLDAAEWALERLSTIRWRFLSLVIEGAADPDALWPVLLGLDLADRITLIFAPPGRTGVMQQDCLVEGIAHNWARNGAWTTTLSLSSYGAAQDLYPPGTGFFILNTSALTTGPGVLVY